MGKQALRRCLYRECRQLFNSRSPAERICPKCRKKHKARLKGAQGMNVVSLTPAMSRHIETLEMFGHKPYKDPYADISVDIDELLEEDVYDSDDDDEIDESKIYEEIANNEDEYDYDSCEELDAEEEIIAEKLSKTIMTKKVSKEKDELFEF